MSSDSSPLARIVELMRQAQPLAAKKVRKSLAGMDEQHHDLANRFLHRYEAYLNSNGQGLEFGVNCYLQMHADMLIERQKFLETGSYSNASYQAVDAAIYSNPEIMTYHMHGLVLAQFLWPEQYKRYLFFREHLSSYSTRRYLEVGGGHGLYILEAYQQGAGAEQLRLVDISSSSLELAQGILRGVPAQFDRQDLFAIPSNASFDFVSVGEVLEHVEDPARMLAHLRSLLAPGGSMFLSTPANAPMIDHIYLFQDADQIRSLISSVGLAIDRECLAYSVEVTDEQARELKIPLMYAAFLRPA